MTQKYETIRTELFAEQVRSNADVYGEVLASGSLVATLHYEVVTTEVDTFGSGVIVGDVVTGLTTTLDASNTVKQITKLVTLYNGDTVAASYVDEHTADDYYIISSGVPDVAVGTFMDETAFEAAYTII